jgi:UDP-N-acetylglucosamine 2-epimerase (non-hydrolysing)
MRVLTVFGTRPEAVKLAPVLLELSRYPEKFESKICVTAQHREMLDQVLGWFDIRPDYDLNLMTPNQDLSQFASKALSALTEVVKAEIPDIVLVQGDTTTVMAASLAAFYQRIPVGHVEAGLRTGDMYAPFPEEMNRRVTGVLASYHYAPTERSRAALLAENVPSEKVLLTGNTVVDAQRLTLTRAVTPHAGLDNGRKKVLVTAHRRENFGPALQSICAALRDLAVNNPDIDVVYPVHLNPNVREPVMNLLDKIPNMFLIDPMRYEQFTHLLSRSHFVITDSGGVQEEAAALGKPTLILRDKTERVEAVESGTAFLVGARRDDILAAVERLLQDDGHRLRMSQPAATFGDGYAAERIVAHLSGLSAS